jgi:hypothetical protein
VTTRLIFSLCAVGVLAVACGPRSRTPDNTSSVPAKLSATTPFGSSLNVDTNDGVRFAFTVINNSGKKIELVFPSGQTHDVAVLDSTGREVWRWSDGRMFTQALQTKLLTHGAEVSYDEQWKDAPAGRYTAVARLNSAAYPVEARSEFVVAAN